MSSYHTLQDCEGVELESGQTFRFACCDCGLVHDAVIVSQDEQPVGFAVRRNAQATTDRRREVAPHFPIIHPTPEKGTSMPSIIGIILSKKLHNWQRIDFEGNDIAPTTADFDAHPSYAGITTEVIDGQHMVRVPAFYYRSGKVAAGDHAGKKALWISPEPAEGFALHPAFRHQGADLAQLYLGEYQGTPDGDKLGSQPGLKPLTRIDFPTMQERAAARGDGWMLWSIYQLAAIQMLALIEMGTPDAQAAIGKGHVSGGGVLPVDDGLVTQASWRGITGLWGNVWQMVDGLQTDGESKYRVWDTSGCQVYHDTDVSVPDYGWFRRRSNKAGEGFDLGALFLPKKTRDDREESGYGDYFWGSDNAVAYHGGDWAYGADDGLFCLDVHDSSSGVNTNLGGRLAKV